MSFHYSQGTGSNLLKHLSSTTTWMCGHLHKLLVGLPGDLTWKVYTVDSYWTRNGFLGFNPIFVCCRPDPVWESPNSCWSESVSNIRTVQCTYGGALLMSSWTDWGRNYNMYTARIICCLVTSYCTEMLM